MKTFHHPNVLPLLGVCIDYDDEDVLKIIMPFMANGDLKTFLKSSRVEPNNTDQYPKVSYDTVTISYYKIHGLNSLFYGAFLLVNSLIYIHVHAYIAL